MLSLNFYVITGLIIIFVSCYAFKSHVSMLCIVYEIERIQGVQTL
jgi:hypothetical protein